MLELLARRWFDGTSLHDEPLRLITDGERIARLEPPGEPIPGATRLEGDTLLPGLINSHAHAARGGGFEADEPPMPRIAASGLAGALRAGVTTMADMGAPAGLARALRGHTERNPTAGPTLLTAGPIITAPEGYPLDWMRPEIAKLGMVSACGTDDQARRAVAGIAAAGMNHVKLAVMHRSYSDQALTVLDTRVGAAAVAEAHALGLRVYAHAHSRDDYRSALDMGADALVHSAFDALDAETVQRVAHAGVSVCPTLWIFESFCLAADEHWAQDPARLRDLPAALAKSFKRFEDAWHASGQVVPEGIAGGLPKARLAEAVRHAAANLLLLRDAGVPIAFGTDAPYGWDLIFRPLDEAQAMARVGLSPLEVLAAATSGAARLLGLGDRGRLAPGLRADLLLVEGDPTRELAALGRIQAVIARGQQVPATSGRLEHWGTVMAYAGGMAAAGRSALRKKT